MTGIVLGLALGWMAAGAFAAGGDHAAAEGEHHATAADNLVVEHGEAPFYHNVLFAATGLFLAAIVLGAPAEKMRGPLPPDPAEAHDDHHH